MAKARSNGASESQSIAVAYPTQEAPTKRVEAILERETMKFKLTDADIEVLESSGVIPKGTPPANIEMFARFCKDTQLSPYKRQVHLIKRYSKDGDRYTIQTGIDGYRAVADRTGRYAGVDDAKFDEGLSQYEVIKSARNHPTTATVTIHKLIGGMRVSFTATAGWLEYCQTFKKDGKESVSGLWAKMPFGMLAKCAESLALRKAFPEELSGVYTDEEMSQADIVEHEIVATITQAKAEKKSDGNVQEKKINEEAAVPVLKNGAVGVKTQNLDPHMKFRFDSLTQEADGAVNEDHLKQIYADGRKFLDPALTKELFNHIVAVQKRKFPKEAF